MTDDRKPDPPSVVMDKFIRVIPSLRKPKEDATPVQIRQQNDKLSQVIITVVDTLFVAPLEQGPNDESAALFPKSKAALAGIFELLHNHDGLLAFISQKDAVRHQGTPLYKALLPRLIYAAVLAAQREDTRDLEDHLIAAASDLLGVLERRQEQELQYVAGWTMARGAVKAIKTFIQGGMQPHPAVLYGYTQLTPSPIASIICIQISVTAQLTFLDDTSIALCAALSALGPVAHTSTAYVKALTAIAPLQARGLEEGLCMALQAHDDIGDLLSALSDDLAEVAWWEIYDNRSSDVSPSKAVFLLSPQARISRHVVRERLESSGLMDAWQHSPHPEVRGAWSAFWMQKGSPRKRKRQDVDDLLRDVVEVGGDPLQAMQAVLKDKGQEIARVFPLVIRKLCQEPDVHLDPLAYTIWQAVCPEDLGLLAVIANHLGPYGIAALLPDPETKEGKNAEAKGKTAEAKGKDGILGKLFMRYRHHNRRIRMPAIRAITYIVGTACQHPQHDQQTVALDIVLKDLRSAMEADSLIVRASSVSLLGAIGAIIPEELTGEVLEMLLLHLGDKGPIQALAVSELLNLARVRNVPVTNLFTPHINRIAPLVGHRLVDDSHFVPAVFDFLACTRKDYLSLPENAAIIVASLVCGRKQAELDTMAGVQQHSVGEIMVEYAAWILARVFRLKNPQPALDFMIEMYDRDNIQTNVKNVMTTCTVKMVNLLVQDLGDKSPKVQAEARQALGRAAQVHGDRSAPHRDVGTFLQPHILGVITTLNEDLHGARRKMTLEGKRRVLRALRNLIEVMGDSLAPTTPQLIASLQSSLSMPGLAEESLVTWCTFMEKLRFSNSGPFVGRTTAAVVANWHLFSAVEKRQAVKLVQEIANNAGELKAHLDDVVDMSAIDDLKKQSDTLLEARSLRSFTEQVETLLERTSSGNTAVATTALREFQTLLATHERDVARLVKGDSFDMLATKIVRGLMVATQEEDSHVRSLAAACLGRLGLLDNDRLSKMVDSGAKIMLHNFRNDEEVADFACMFIRDVLVDSYKITNDIKYQGFLAYAMQELLRLCGFKTDIIDQTHKFDVKVQDRWKRLPKYQVEALSPLLHTRFKLSTEGSARKLETPYYEHANTYREWVQNWSIMLLQRICDFTTDDAPGHARQIFGVLRGVLRNQDVSVALYVLPHMVLHVLLSGNEDDRLAVAKEINTVLKDQVNTAGLADKRALSAQVIFDLMDHLGKWLRRFRHLVDSDRQAKLQQNRHLQNQPEPKTHPHIVTVERVLGSVNTELLANAALQSKAYARSLLNFEQRIIEVHDKCDPRKEPPPLYAYYERLHEIYADLDEPDGMEGVSMYVMAPSLEYQIREHESTGRWTSAQSCWEVRLQQSPDDLALHQGLLRCLRNLGHYDTLRTHIRGVLSKKPEWRTELAPFEAEAAWLVGDWETVKSVADHGYPMADVMLQLHLDQSPKAITDALEKARIAAGNEITSITYSRATEPILSLHILRELEMIHDGSLAYNAERNGTAPRTGNNREKLSGDILQHLRQSLSDRFETTAPAFRIRETILSARRTAFGTSPTAALRNEIGKAWILSSKMARKAGYEQTAYSAALQAKEVDAPYAFVQQAKLTKLHFGVWKALEELTKSLDPLIVHAQMEGGFVDKSDKEKYDRQKSLAKAVLLEARWTLETGRMPHNELIPRFIRAVQFLPELESPYYHLGHFYDGLAGRSDPISHNRAQMNYLTCHNYTTALRFGNKYIFRTMPRTLTIWLDLGEVKGTKAELKHMSQNLERITLTMDKARNSLAAYQFLTAFPQIASRLGHKNVKIRHILIKILGNVINEYPKQAIWPMFGLMNSSRKERKEQCKEVMARVMAMNPIRQSIIIDAEKFSSNLLKLADEPIPDKAKSLDLSSFPYMRSVFPSQMMMPLQDLLTGTLPSHAENEDIKKHDPFPMKPVMIESLSSTIDVMSSLVKPKKLVFMGNDSKAYPFLCKPKDDLRKDARLMDFNAMINKLLKSASESRRRQLHIRTYAVMPLNELCGLIEWVSNTLPLKVILEDQYKRKSGKKLYTHELHKKLEDAKAGGPPKQIQTFQDYIIPHFKPCAFPDWFLVTWPEPASWLTARLSYARTLAVMSMIGYVLGLGDRHCENILFDSLSGDTVHVDLNCLFDKGKTFEIPERVPFRLTQNLVAAMGVTKTEGVFRKASEISMGILRDNAESLMSVLEAFVHDPLVEWTSRKSTTDIRATADKHLGNINTKLRGIVKQGNNGAGEIASVNNQVEMLISQATAPHNLAVMYQGWAPWL